MYKFIAIFALIVVAQAARIPRATVSSEVVALLKSDSDFQPDGSFTFSFELNDGTVREEKGVVMNAGKEDAYVAVTGTYKYVDPEGQTVEVHYTADEHGFVPSGPTIHNAIIAAAKSAIEKH